MSFERPFGVHASEAVGRREGPERRVEIDDVYVAVLRRVEDKADLDDVALGLRSVV